MSFVTGLSIVIPLAPNESDWEQLLSQLQLHQLSQDIILSSTELEPERFKELTKTMPGFRWIIGPKGRAKQLNLGARSAKGDHILFLHADSKLNQNSKEAIDEAMAKNQKCLYFFRLKFKEKFNLMKINEFGVWIRSVILRIPFGDQGFLLEKEIFETLGCFDEGARFGEDHLLVWKAHQAGIRVVPLKSSISTSARKYIKNGWGKTTLRHIQLTAAQAAPEIKKLLSIRWRSFVE